MRKIITLSAAFLIALASPVLAKAGSVSAALSITIQSPYVLALAPSAVTEQCTVAAGTVISTATTSGGDGNPIVYSMSGVLNNDFVIDPATGIVTVGTNGINSADCTGLVSNYTVTATQN